MNTPDLEAAIDASHRPLDAILKGDSSVYASLYSESDDVTLGNPFGPYAHGRARVEVTLAGAVSNYRAGNWKLVHRHADPMMSPRPASSVIGT